MKNNWKEKLWEVFEKSRFVSSINSITDEQEEMEGEVTDMEAVIRLKGEFDKYEIENFIESLLEEQKHDYEILVNTILEGHKKELEKK